MVSAFFHSADFTFVCPTELEDLADNYEEFLKLGVKSSVSTDSHWTIKHGMKNQMRSVKLNLLWSVMINSNFQNNSRF